MEIFKFNIIPTAEFEKRENFRHSTSHCPVCDSELEFNYQQLSSHAVLQEDAKCTTCDHQKESSHHRIH